MKRREAISVVITGSVLSAGCLGIDPEPSGSNTAIETTTSETKRTSSDQTKKTDTSTYNLPYRLIVKNESDSNIEFKITLRVLKDGTPTEAVLSSKTYNLKSGEEVSLDEYISPSTPYTINIEVDEGTSDNWRLYPYAALSITILSKSELDITTIER